LSSAPRYFDAHFFLPAPHFVWSSGGGSMAATSDATQPSTLVSAVAVSSSERQSFGVFASSFSKQPFAGTVPPSNLIFTLVTHSLALGSAGLPGVSASASHLSRPAAVLAMQVVLAARHFACWADAGASGTSTRAIASAVAIERIVGRIISTPLVPPV